MTDKMCLQCHGKMNEAVKPKTLEFFAKRYPNEKATGYGLDVLRGIYVLEMQPK